MEQTRHTLVNTRPASFHHEIWKDATPLGNGEAGAMIQGGIKEEYITLTRHDLWDWGVDTPLPDVHETLQQSRDAIDRGDYAYANELLPNTLKENGYGVDQKTLTFLSAPFPLGKMKLQIGEGATFYHYRRMLDMEHGILHIGYELEASGAKSAAGAARNRFEREAFVSRADNVTVYHLTGSARFSSVKLSLDIKESNYVDIVDGLKKRAMGMYEQFAQTRECYIKDGLLYFGFAFDGGKWAGAVVRVLQEGGSILCEEKTYTIQNAQEITILVKTFTGAKEDFTKYAGELQQISYSYPELKERHAAVFAKEYHTSEVCLAKDDSVGYQLSNEELIEQAYDDVMSPEFIEKLWRFSRYLFISGTSPKTNPLPLLGLWPCDYELPWPQHIANENVQLIYWHVNTGGLASYAKSLIHYYYEKIPQMQENARKLFGCRGIFLSTYTTPIDSLIAPAVPVITNWISGAGWICKHFYDYYRYTKDEELLQEEILPFMLETAAFYEDYLCYDENGRMKIYPSVSPENSPKNFQKKGLGFLGHSMPAVKNATMDFAILKEVLTNLLEACKERGIYEDKQVLWEEILSKIPAYMINEDGAVKEWMSEDLEDYYLHRHLSHIYPVFPGDEITTESDEKIYRAFEKAVDLRIADGQCGWSMVHKAAIYSRFGRGEDAIACLDQIPKSVLLDNFVTMGDDYRGMGISFEDPPLWCPIQLDVNMGYINAVQEMLFRYQNDALYLLPACPKRWNEGEVKDFCFPGGKIDFAWNLEQKKLKVMIRLDAQATAATEGFRRPKVVLPEGMEDAVIEWN